MTPKHRRAGIGTKLVQHFLAILKEQDPEAKVGFTSSPTARFMYEKQGFRVVSWFNYTFEDTDDEGRPYKHRTRWPYMTNTYQTQSPQLDLHRLASRQAYDGPADGDPEITEGL